jgi:hypothetical protein
VQALREATLTALPQAGKNARTSMYLAAAVVEEMLFLRSATDLAKGRLFGVLVDALWDALAPAPRPDGGGAGDICPPAARRLLELCAGAS